MAFINTITAIFTLAVSVYAIDLDISKGKGFNYIVNKREND